MISIIIVTYNSIEVLPKCLKALEKSKGSFGFEVVLVDNCSNDGTLSWLSEYQKANSNSFRALHTHALEKNIGYAAANNIGLSKASGKLALLLNPDTLVSPETIDTCVSIFDDNPRIGVVGCKLVLADGSLDGACKRGFPNMWNSFCRFVGLSSAFHSSRIFCGYSLGHLDPDNSYPVDCVSGAFMMVRHSIIKETGGLDERYFLYGEDIDWCLQIKRMGYVIWYEGSVTTVHFKGANGGKQSKVSLYHFYNAMGIYLDKNFRNKYPIMVINWVKLILKVLFWGHYFRLRIGFIFANKE